MSVKSDGRRRTDLELFVLALLAEGVSTAYELMIHADLSPGATLPVLGRLRSYGFVRMKKAAMRKRATFELTTSGTRWLHSGWKDLLQEEPTGSVDTILRAALLAVVVGRNRRAAKSFLRRAAEVRKKGSGSAGKPEIVSPKLAATYRSLRASINNELRTAETIALSHLADGIASSKGGQLYAKTMPSRSKRVSKPSRTF